MNRRFILRHRFLLGAIGLVALLSLVYGGWRSASITTLPIGLVVPDTSSSQGVTMLRGAQLAVDMLNERMRVSERPFRFKLLIHQDQHDSHQAQRAAEILEESGALAVIGHADNLVNSSVAPRYNAMHMVMINPSSTNTDFLHYNPWSFSTMVSAAVQGDFLIHFLQSTSKRNAIYIVESNDNSSKEVAKAAIATAKSLNINILKRWQFDAAEKIGEDQLEEILDTIRADPAQEQHAVLVATTISHGVQLVTALKRIGHHLMLLAPHNFSDERFINALNRYPQARAQPGYYSDGLFVVTPYLSQAGLTNRTAARFQDSYRKQFHEQPGWLAAAWYDATITAGTALADLNNAVLTSKETGTVRQHLLDRLRHAYTYNQGFDGVNGRIYFDPEGGAFRSLAVAFFSHQKLIPADHQFQPLTYPERETHVLEDVLRGTIFTGINGQLFRRTRVVYTGVDINRISNLDLLNSSFDTDFYLWFRYRGQFDDSAVDFLNANEAIDLGKPIIVDHDHGMTTHAYRVQGTFRSPFDFHDYPFDQQQLKIEFKHRSAQKKDLIYVTDSQGLRQDAEQRGNNSHLHLGGWFIQSTAFFQEIASTSSTLGVPRFMAHGNLIEYSQFTATVALIRDSLNFVIKHLMTLVILLIVTYIIYYLPPNQMELSGGITMTSLLTAAVMHQEMNASLPEVGYTVAIDYVFFISYVMMASSALYPLIQYNRARARMDLKWVRLVGRIGYPMGVLIIIITMYYLLDARR